MSCISAHDPQLARLADAIAQRVGQQRFHVWFNNSTKLDLRNDGLEIAVGFPTTAYPTEILGDVRPLERCRRPIRHQQHAVLGHTSTSRRASTRFVSR